MSARHRYRNQYLLHLVKKLSSPFCLLVGLEVKVVSATIRLDCEYFFLCVRPSRSGLICRSCKGHKKLVPGIFILLFCILGNAAIYHGWCACAASTASLRCGAATCSGGYVSTGPRQTVFTTTTDLFEKFSGKNCQVWPLFVQAICLCHKKL